jgi:integrase
MLEIYLEPTQGRSYVEIVADDEGPQGRIYLFGTKGQGGGGKRGRIAQKRSRLAQVIPELVPVLAQRINRRLNDDHRLLFSRPDGGPYSRWTFERMWLEIMRLCEIDRGWIQSKTGGMRRDIPSIHEGRHTYATWEIASRRLNDVEVATQIGNAPHTTRDTYQHAIVEGLYKVNKIPKWRALAEALHKNRRLRAVG